jgi:hypothetical protein
MEIAAVKKMRDREDAITERERRALPRRQDRKRQLDPASLLPLASLLRLSRSAKVTGWLLRKQCCVGPMARAPRAGRSRTEDRAWSLHPLHKLDPWPKGNPDNRPLCPDAL